MKSSESETAISDTAIWRQQFRRRTYWNPQHRRQPYWRHQYRSKDGDSCSRDSNKETVILEAVIPETSIQEKAFPETASPEFFEDSNSGDSWSVQRRSLSFYTILHVWNIHRVYSSIHMVYRPIHMVYNSIHMVYSSIHMVYNSIHMIYSYIQMYMCSRKNSPNLNIAAARKLVGKK
jgi:hypothetical protein